MKSRNSIIAIIYLLSITSLLFLNCQDPNEPQWNARFSNKKLILKGDPVLGSTIEFSTSEILGDQPTLKYKWMHGNAPVDNGTLEKITISNLEFSDSGYYWCIVTNNFGTDTSNKFPLKVWELPKITNTDKAIQTNPAIPVKNTLFKLFVNATGTDLKYKWYQIDSLQQDGNSNILPLYNVDESDTGNYNCIVYNDYGKDTSKTYTLFFEATKTFIVIYNGNGNTSGFVPVDTNKYQQGTIVTVKGNIGNLAKIGYTFNGWNTSDDGSGTNYIENSTFSIGVKDIKLYAQWSNATYIVKFNSNGGSKVDSQIVLYNNQAQEPAPPVKNGYIFSGWYTDQALTIAFIFSTPIIGSITLYAKWVPVYTVKYNGNNNTAGTVPLDTNKYVSGANVTVMDNIGSLERTGYTFLKWNTNANGTGVDRIPGETFTVGSVNITFYAKWSIINYSINYNLNGGNNDNNNPLSYTIESPEITLEPAIKTGYIFDGWYSDIGFTIPIVTIPTGSNGNKTIYAKWIIKDINGNIYTEIKIGTQTWMVENFKATKFNDGTPIPIVEDSASWAALAIPGFCWYNNDSTYKSIYGTLYNWCVVINKNIAPTGWHVPSDTEWVILSNFLGGDVVAGAKMKESGTIHWTSPNDATNSSGFTALPGGHRSDGGNFASISDNGYWWSSTTYDSLNAWGYGLRYDYSNLKRWFDNSKKCGYSLRLLRNY